MIINAKHNQSLLGRIGCDDDLLKRYCFLLKFLVSYFCFFIISLYPPIPLFSQRRTLAIVAELLRVSFSISRYAFPSDNIFAAFHLCANSESSFSVSRSLKNFRASATLLRRKIILKRPSISSIS